MKRRIATLSTLKFVILAVGFMILADHFIFGGKRSYIEEARTHKVQIEMPEEADASAPRPVRVTPPDGKEFFESEIIAPPTPAPLPKGQGKIAIIIDDIGMDIKHSFLAIDDLPPEITMAILPYAPKAREMAARAKAKGHEIIIHVPMEAMDGGVNIGPGGLKVGMGEEEFTAAFSAMLGSFEGYVGINNHMGSRLTQDEASMTRVMNMLSPRGLFFVDSMTSDQSVATIVAARAGIKHAARDIFLDHEETYEFARDALKKAEKRAFKNGSAIAIGHPKEKTLAAIKEWMADAKARGITFVPVSELIVTPR